MNNTTRRDFLKASALTLTELFCLPSFADEPIELVILHTNDHHGVILPENGKGGLAIQSTVINRERAKYKNVLLVDSGDYNTGQAISNLLDAKPDLTAYKMMKYDVMTIGNHEFDNLKDCFHKQSAFITSGESLPPISLICSNVHYRSTGELVLPPYVIKQIAGLRVGLFGLLINQPSLLDGSSFIAIDDEIETAKKMVKTLREKENVDVVIALTHMGDVPMFDGHVTSVDLGNAVEGIDLIIDGHSHSYFTQPKQTKGAPVVTAYAYSQYVGKAILKIQGGKVTLDSWTTIPVDSNTEPAPEISNALEPDVQKASAELKTVVAHATDQFLLNGKECRAGECAICDLVCDLTIDYLIQKGTPVDFVLLNGGLFRAGLPKGDITKGDIKTCLPYKNIILILIEMKGADVIDLFNYVASIYQTNGAFGQVSKQVRYTITYNNGIDGVISDLTIDSKPVDPEKIYKIAVTSYMFNGGDGYDILKRRAINSHDTGVMLSNAIIEILKSSNKPISPVLDGRINILGGLEEFKHITEANREFTDKNPRKN